MAKSLICDVKSKREISIVIGAEEVAHVELENINLYFFQKVRSSVSLNFDNPQLEDCMLELVRIEFLPRIVKAYIRY